MFDRLRRRTSPVTSTADSYAEELDRIAAAARAGIVDELNRQCTWLAARLTGGRRVRAVRFDGQRGSMRVDYDEGSFTCAVAGDIAAQVEAMVGLEPTVVRPGRVADGRLQLAFYSSTWAYAIEVVPALDA